MRRLCLVSLFAATFLTAGCGSGAGPPVPTIPAARTFQLWNFEPRGRVEPGKPVALSFTIRQPSGRPLTRYRRGAGPHTGIHVILVDRALREIIHRHPPISEQGEVRQALTFPSSGLYRLVVDAYPALEGALRNFQLFRSLDVGARTVSPPALPPFDAVQHVEGFRVALPGKPLLRAIEPAFLTVSVTGRDGKPASFTPYYGALAHAIFFHAGNLDYFHTPTCAQPGRPAVPRRSAARG